ncbi:MAG: hypothetical protein EBS19_15450, partial [Spirochaetia bacterium]|nr:hypothetical protein [Spirochaetia bacterium]
MRIANKVLIFFFLIACSILLPSCNQQTTRINHLNRETLNVSLDSTVAFIAERNTSETRPTVRVFCSGFFISERLLLSALHCFQDTVTVRLPNDEIIQIPTVLDPRGR